MRTHNLTQAQDLGWEVTHDRSNRKMSPANKPPASGKRCSLAWIADAVCRLGFIFCLKGILPDVQLRALSKFSKSEFFAYFCSSPLRSTTHKGIRLKSFQYEMREIFTESLVHETFFNTVYRSNETHIIMHNLKM